MPGWGRPLGSFIVGSPPVIPGGAQPAAKGLPNDRPGPKGLLGIQPSVFHARVEMQTRLDTKARATLLSAEVWVRTAGALSMKATQLSAEVWARNYRQTSRTFYYPKDRMGPQGFLGVVPATFKDRLTFQTSDPGAHPSVANFSIPDDRYGFGPKGLLGIPIRKFREGGLSGPFGNGFGPAPSNLKATQLSVEAWARVKDTTLIQATQLSVEVWMSTKTPTIDWLTQSSVEAWVTTAAASPPISSTRPFLWVIT